MNMRSVVDGGYLLSESGHAQLCEVVEHLSLLAELGRGYVPATDESSHPPFPASWAAGLGTLVGALDQVIAGLIWRDGAGGACMDSDGCGE